MYVQFEAFDSWAAIEAESGASLFTRTGGLDVLPRGGKSFARITDNLNRHKISYDLLTPAQVWERFHVRIEDPLVGIYQSDAVRVARVQRTHWRVDVCRAAVLSALLPSLPLPSSAVLCCALLSLFWSCAPVRVYALGGCVHRGRYMYSPCSRCLLVACSLCVRGAPYVSVLRARNLHTRVNAIAAVAFACGRVVRRRGY